MARNYNRTDRFYKKAKAEGYRSRAAYKLLEIQNKYRFIKPGAKVFDLGSWPGGWLQVAAELVGPQGLVVGVDLQAIEPLGLAQVQFLQGDASDRSLMEIARRAAGGGFDAVISDMSPKLCGIREVDESATANCSHFALEIARELLFKGGSLVVKVFKNPEAQQFVKSLKPLFNNVIRSELDSSRSSSNEFYVLALGYQAKA